MLSLSHPVHPDEVAFLVETLGVESWSRLLAESDAAIREEPEVGNHWHRRGLALLRLERARDAERSFLRQIALEHRVGTAYYNLACVRAHEGDLDGSLAYARKALSHGYDNRDALRTDPDLALLRLDPRFEECLLSRLEAEEPTP